MDNTIAMSKNAVVAFLGKKSDDFTREDIIRFIAENGIEMVNFMYPAADCRLKTLNFVINDKAYLETILTLGERVDGSSLFPFISAGSSDLYVIPRYSTAFVDPFAEYPTLTMLCSFFDKDGNPLYARDKNGTLLDGSNGTQKVYQYPLFETSDGSAEFTASNIKIASGWANGSYGIRPSNNYVTVDKETGSTANENVLNMVKLLEKNISFSAPNSAGNNITFYKGSFHDCFANIEATLGIDYKSAQTMLANQISVLNQTSNSRDAVSGVQLDEEGMDLLHYNQSYSAAARFLTTLDEALDKLINGTGVVGR